MRDELKQRLMQEVNPRAPISFSRVCCVLNMIFFVTQVDVDADTGEPSDNLTELAVKFCKSLTCEAKTVSEILSSNDEKIMKAIKEGIDRANAKAVSRAQKVGRVINSHS